jgi:hypothetical protein
MDRFRMLRGHRDMKQLIDALDRRLTAEHHSDLKQA